MLQPPIFGKCFEIKFIEPVLNMDSYKNVGNDTGVIAFEAGNDSILIKFRDGSVYLYTAQSTGAAAIAQMKRLAKKGAGLTTYINQHVREKYECKVR